jgi:NAD(P)-dependent dehydrogenase (short-subunit alcohol dehydrogenase family)
MALGEMRGRICVVTGASSGIGREVARSLAALGATVVLACRSERRGEEARASIVASTENPNVAALPVDLAAQASIRAFGRAFRERYARLHVLINNAGVWLPSREWSADGIELTWATNVLGYHLLARLLEGALVAGAPARIVNVASTYAGGLDLDDVEFRRRRYDGVAAYRQSKQADRMLTWALARRLAGSGVTANAVHPGGVASGIYRRPSGPAGTLLRAWVRLIKLTPSQGAETPTWAAASNDLAGESGRFFVRQRERPCSFRDSEAVERLWATCEEMTS